MHANDGCGYSAGGRALRTVAGLKASGRGATIALTASKPVFLRWQRGLPPQACRGGPLEAADSLNCAWHASRERPPLRARGCGSTRRDRSRATVRRRIPPEVGECSRCRRRSSPSWVSPSAAAYDTVRLCTSQGATVAEEPAPHRSHCPQPFTMSGSSGLILPKAVPTGRQ